MLGTHSLVGTKRSRSPGADADFHRRDLWEAIESGHYPEWELGLQIFTEEQAESFSFDVLDSTKLIPEEMVPVTPVGRMVLNRNPDNFFAETEQVAFCTAHVVPGIDFSNDPLLHGRIHSYRRYANIAPGRPELPRDTDQCTLAPCTTISATAFIARRFRGAEWPTSRILSAAVVLSRQAPMVSPHLPHAISSDNTPVDKVRGKPEKFAEHYNQATLFFNSQTSTEKAHIIAAFRFELSKLTVPAIRLRMLSSLLNVSKELASAVADGLGLSLPDPMPRAAQKSVNAEVKNSPPLSLMALPGTGAIATRKIAVLIAAGMDVSSIEALQTELTKAGAVIRFLGARLGAVKSESGAMVEADATLENSPSVLFDGVIVPSGDGLAQALAKSGQAVEFLKDQYRHCKTLLVLGASVALLDKAGIPKVLPSGKPDPGLLIAPQGATAAKGFIAALAKHRHPERDQDPPSV